MFENEKGLFKAIKNVKVRRRIDEFARQFFFIS